MPYFNISSISAAVLSVSSIGLLQSPDPVTAGPSLTNSTAVGYDLGILTETAAGAFTLAQTPTNITAQFVSNISVTSTSTSLSFDAYINDGLYTAPTSTLEIISLTQVEAISQNSAAVPTSQTPSSPTMTSFMKTDYLSAASLSSTLSRVTPLSGPGSSATTISIQSTPCSSKRSPSGAADPPIIGWQPNIKSHNISTPNLIYAGSPATKSTSAFVAEDLNVTPLPSQKSSVASSSPIACSTAQLVTVIIIGREPITLCRPQPPISTLPTTPAITSTSPPQKAWQIDDKVLTSAPSPTYTPANNILETFAVLSSAVVVDDHTLTPGSPALTVDGNIISLGFSIFVIGTKTEDWATGAATNPAVASSIGIGELILKGFGQIGGTVLSASSTTTSTPTSPPTTPIPTTTASSPLTTIPPLDLIVGSETLTFVSDNILIAGQTLTPGSPGITVDGELISLGSSLFIEGTTVTQTYSTTVSVPSATTILSTSTFKPLVTSSPRSKAPQSSATTTASTSSSTSQPPGPAYTYDGTPFSSSSASGWRQWRIPVEAGAALMLFPFILSL